MAINNFPAFAKLVHSRFQETVKSPHVFMVNVSGDVLYERYLAAFPKGTNPIFKERSEHDCSCCKQFIRRVGAIRAQRETKTGLSYVYTVWDEAAEAAPYPYNEVAKVLRTIVQEAQIADLFRVSSSEGSFGAEATHSQNENGDALTWNHFYTGPLPSDRRVGSPGEVLGEYRTTVGVFERGLKELAPEAVATVLSLVEGNALYRGAEFKEGLVEFQKAQRAYAKLNSAHAQNGFVWTRASGPVSRFRNTVMGTLLVDLSSGVDIEKAVRDFETKVAPQNYKRTSALITPAMVEKARETIQALGLEPALERRFARIEDVSVSDVLWVDNAVKPLMKGGVLDALMQHAQSSNRKSTEEDEKRAVDVSIDEFVRDVLPSTTGMELLFKGGHLGNLMSLTAPVHPEPKQLFKWGNDFAWSYVGSVADSIKERVKRAGGNVTNAGLRISLSWFNHDDLDLHVFEPNSRRIGTAVSDLWSGNGVGHIFFGRKIGRFGVLDVDMNAGGGFTREPVENVSFVGVPDGEYRVVVNSFNKRETDFPGFTIEVENAGKLSHFSYDAGVRAKADVQVATLHLKSGVIVRVDVGDPGIRTTAISQEKWGLTTDHYVKVNAVTLSPNYWGENKVGNKHTFFVLDGCKNDEPTRGIYNEFLHSRLEQHRKVFEMIGEKTKCQPTDGQLSGVGFSSTKRDSVIIKVYQGKKHRLYNVQIGAPSASNKGDEQHEKREHV